MIKRACPACGVTKLSPARARRDDVRRFCLPCSEASGRLVERVSPARLRKEAKAKAARRAEANARAQLKRAWRAEERARWVHNGFDIRPLAIRIWRAAGLADDPEPESFVVRQGADPGFIVSLVLAAAVRRSGDLRRFEGQDRYWEIATEVWPTLKREVGPLTGPWGVQQAVAALVNRLAGPEVLAACALAAGGNDSL